MIDDNTKSMLIDKMYELVKAMAMNNDLSNGEVTHAYEDALGLAMSIFYKISWEEQLALCKEYTIFQGLVYNYLDDTQRTALSLVDD